MCNPTKTPSREAAAPSNSHPSVVNDRHRNNLPPSPASTPAAPSRMSSSSASSSNENPRGTPSSAPVLKLVSSLRSSEGSPASEPTSASPSRRMLRTPPRDASSSSMQGTFLPRLPLSGEESRDDGQARQRLYRPQPTIGDDYDDEIPSLVDEDEHEEDFQDYQRRRRQSPPVQLYQQQLRNEDSNRCSSRGQARHPTTKARRPQAQPKQETTEDPQDEGMPFFVLDWMIQDLVPKHQDAQDLAKLLNHEDSKAKASESYTTLRKSKSFGLVGSSTANSNNNNNESNSNSGWNLSAGAASPLLRKFLPWSPKETTEGNAQPPTPASRRTSKPSQASQIFAQQSRRPSSPVPISTSSQTIDSATPEQAQPFLPLTPKSSNRRVSRIRDKLSSERRECLAVGIANGEEVDGLLLLPRTLDESLEKEHQNDTASHETEATQETDMSSTASPSPLKLLPRVASSAPSPTPPHQGLFSSSQSPAKRINSCPQFFPADDDNEALNREEDLHRSERYKAMQLRKRQEQIDRRERRNKLTVVQRSLTLAQGWNNKGLTMAGRATQAEHHSHQYSQEASNANHSSPSRAPLALSVDDADDDHDDLFANPHVTAAERFWNSSLGCWDNALEIYRSLLGEYHERVADVQNNRGIALGKLGRFDEALQALGMALEARKKQQQRARHEDADPARPNHPRSPKQQPGNNPNAPTDAGMAAATAIVSTLHNIANVFRDAGDPNEALTVLIEAQTTLVEAEHDLERRRVGDATVHRHHCWHQSARLCTAIGHAHYEAESWRGARDAYGDALEIYDRLARALARQSDRLGWGHHPEREAQRLEILKHRQLIQREVAVLEDDLEVLERQQQAREGSRAHFLQAHRRQQQRQRETSLSPQHKKHPQQPSAQQQQPPPPPQQQQTLFGIVSSLRA